MTVTFTDGQLYSKKDIYRVLQVPESKQRGAWDTGYLRYEGRFFLFVNIGIAGRTGHDYQNQWSGDNLLWYGKTLSTLHQPLIQSLLASDAEVLIFTRTSDRSPFTYEGKGSPMEVYDEQPVKVLWEINRSGF